MAGGGSTLSVPTFLFLGLDAATANDTNRVALLIECFAGVRGFHDQQQSMFADSLRLSLLTLPGALIGAWFAVRIDGEWFHIILSLVMVGVVLSAQTTRSQCTLDHPTLLAWRLEHGWNRLLRRLHLDWGGISTDRPALPWISGDLGDGKHTQGLHRDDLHDPCPAGICLERQRRLRIRSCPWC